jgi:nitrate reductase gamma subunit
MMDAAIALAKGPLFRIALAVCVLGLTYHFLVTLIQIVQMKQKAADKRVPVRRLVMATFSWLLPAHLLKIRPLFGLASGLFHLGILAVPLFYVGHVTLWQSSLPLRWPTLSSGISDALAILAIVGLVGLLASRLLYAANRDLTMPQDVILLVVLLALVASGYWAAHPPSSPLHPRTMLLVHMLLGNLALLLTPLTKIAHCILYPLAQFVSDLGWRFPAASGRHVGMVLQKDEESI